MSFPVYPKFMCRLGGTIFPALLLLPLTTAVAFPAQSKERTASVTVDVQLTAPTDAKTVRIWVPYPMSDANQEITDIDIHGNFSSCGVYREGAFGNSMLYAEWKDPVGNRTLAYTFSVRRKEVETKNFPGKELPFSASEFRRELASTWPASADSSLKETAAGITRGKENHIEKTRAIYDWIVENMYRDPATKGCGLGDVGKLLMKLGGKCADIHSVFVALARSAGIPAREVFGIRLPKGSEGEMTKAQHCWAEWYLPGHGWVVVDPADVRKAILEKKISLAEAEPLRKYYFGTVDENRIAFGSGRHIRLNPPQAGEPLNYFMYPYAEADGKPLNEDLYGFNLGYKIRFREL